MYCVLIVEDEALIRQGLIRSIRWDELKMTLAGEAENGVEALEILRSRPVDVILTDMRMPVCDGQQMLQEIERQKLDCEIIVLSEYTDFAYMRQAIHAHVFDYLLKPVDAVSLNSLFQRVKEKLDEKNRAAQMTQDALTALFSDAAFSEPVRFTECFAAYVEKHGDNGFALCEILLKKEENAENTLTAVLGQSPFENRLLCLQKGKRFAVLTLLPAQTAGSYRARLQTAFGKLALPAEFRLGLSEKKNSLRLLPEALNEAAAALSFLPPGRAIVEYSSVKALTTVRYPAPVNGQQLKELLKSGRDFRKELKLAFQHELEKKEMICLPAMKRMLVEFSLSLERCCQETGRGVNISALIGGNYLDRINQIQWRQEMDALFEEIVDKTFAAIAEQDTFSTDSILRHVLNAVQTRYMEDLSLISFAQEYHINYIYLSRKFKELTGETFTNYLMQIRMDKARQLIEQDGFSEKAAAPLVGYSNPYYFISSYRKYFGLEEQNEN